MMKRSLPISPSHTLLAFCLHLLCLVERCKAQAASNATTDPSEVRAFNAIFQQWNLSASDEWNISGEPCSGIAVDSSTISNPRIKCNCSSNGGSTCHITQIKLQGLQVRGVIPDELQNLTFLTDLDLSQNFITVPLPAFIGRLASIRSLVIRSNNFSGLLPSELRLLLSLQQLDVSSNFGTVQLGNLPSLQQLNISHNSYAAELPPELGNLFSLQQLDISHNSYSGWLPPQLGNLSSLQQLVISYNYFANYLPPELRTLASLQQLDISNNNFANWLPPQLGNLSSLQQLNISYNNFNNSLPLELGKLASLQLLAISANNFSGLLPPELGNSKSLRQLYMVSSGLSGGIPSTFANLTNMKILWASDNQFTGKIPDFIGSWNLTNLNIQGNAFEGPIPSSFSNLTSLTDLDLSFNNLSGQIPNSLFNMSSLIYLFLGNNSLSGALPSQKSNKLLNVDLSYNQLSGSFPSWVTEEGLNLNLVANNFVFDSSNSSGLPLSLNCLQRSFPCHRNPPIHSSFAIRCGGPTMTTTGTEYEADNATLGPASYNVASTEKWAVSNVGRFSEGSNNRYYRYTQEEFPNTIDSGLFQYARLSPGSLRYYGLGLENGNYTVNLRFAETEFPDSQTRESVGKRIFDIYLQGKLEWRDFDIKKEAGVAFRGIEKERWVMVSENVLEIHLLWAGKGTCCIPSPGTYGPTISAFRVTPNFEPTVGTSRKKNKTALVVGISVSAGVLSIIFVLVVFIWKRSKRLSVDEDEEFLRMGPRPNTFSYAELKTATEDFNPANKLGQGGFGPVFKGTLLDGRIVAVKQLSVTSHQGKSQFVAEIAAISAVQQRNLVKLHGCCIEGAHRLLVYEYLENKSLDQALFGESKLHLDWHSRFEICLGTARGLAYLHEESSPRIVHRDVKASNILLDTYLNPKISDFGLAKFYDDKMSHISTGVAGTIGYLAPEYAMRGHLTEKADVFAFGVVALEIVSGRPNTYQDLDPEKVYLLEWAWYLHENDHALELVDPTLSEFNEGEVSRMIGIALLCIQALPSLRPSMSRVVNMLLGDIEVGTVSSKPSYLTGLPSDDTGSLMIYDTSTVSLNASGSRHGATEAMLHEVIGNGQ